MHFLKLSFQVSSIDFLAGILMFYASPVFTPEYGESGVYTGIWKEGVILANLKIFKILESDILLNIGTSGCLTPEYAMTR